MACLIGCELSAGFAGGGKGAHRLSGGPRALSLGYEVVRSVPATSIGDLIRIKLADDPFFTIELVSGSSARASIVDGIADLWQIAVGDLVATGEFRMREDDYDATSIRARAASRSAACSAGRRAIRLSGSCLTAARKRSGRDPVRRVSAPGAGLRRSGVPCSNAD